MCNRLWTPRLTAIISRSIILKQVIDRLSQATPAENHACLYDACIEAQETYNK